MLTEQPNLQRRGLLKIILACGIAPAIIKIGVLDKIGIPKGGDLVRPEFTLMNGEAGLFSGFTVYKHQQRIMDYFANYEHWAMAVTGRGVSAIPIRCFQDCKLQDGDNYVATISPDYGQLLFDELKGKGSSNR